VKALALVVLAAASPALAETPLPPKKKQPDPPPPPSPPDPIVVDAQNANLESTARHQGLFATFAVGGGFTVGLGIDNSVGRGPGASLRLAQTASERFAFTLEIASVVNLHQIKGTNVSGDLLQDRDTNLLIGLQFFVKNSLWLRTAGGIGGLDPAGTTKRNLVGPAGLIGIGFDVVRTKRLSLGFEWMSIGMINRDGLLASNAFMLDVGLE